MSFLVERDTLDSSAFPSIGERVVASHRLSRDSLGATIEGERTGIDALKFFSWDRNTLGIWGTVATSYDDASDTAFADSLSAGGFLNLSGYANRELSGRHLGLVRGLFYRRLSGPALRNFVDFPLYAGSSLEFGGIWQDSDEISFSNTTVAGSLFLGLDSIIGPLFLAVGLAEGGENAVYLSLGRPFIYDVSSEFE
jgi:NTE family protein